MIYYTNEPEIRQKGAIFMAFDGTTVAAVTKELTEQLSGGRIAKIAQPETDELLFTIKTRTRAKAPIYLSQCIFTAYLSDKCE